MKLAKTSYTIKGDGQAFYNRLRELKEGDEIKGQSLIPALPAKTKLTCVVATSTHVLLDASFCGIVLGEIDAAWANGMLKLEWLEGR